MVGFASLLLQGLLAVEAGALLEAAINLKRAFGIRVLELLEPESGGKQSRTVCGC